MKTKASKFVVMASYQDFSRKSYYNRFWMAASAEPFSRRQWLDEIAAAIYDYDGLILSSDGRVVPVPDIDAVFTDPENRGWSNFLEKNATGGGPRRHCLRSLPKLQLVDLYFKIRKPHIARHFGR